MKSTKSSYDISNNSRLVGQYRLGRFTLQRSWNIHWDASLPFPRNEGTSLGINEGYQFKDWQIEESLVTIHARVMESFSLARSWMQLDAIHWDFSIHFDLASYGTEHIFR